MHHIKILSRSTIPYYLSSHWIIKFPQFFFSKESFTFEKIHREYLRQMNAAEFQGDYNRERIDALRLILFSSIKYRFRHSGHLPGYSARYVLTFICTYGLWRGVLTTYRRSILEYAIAGIDCHNSHNQSDQSQRSRRVFSAFRQIHRSLSCRYWSMEIFVNKKLLRLIDQESIRINLRKINLLSATNYKYLLLDNFWNIYFELQWLIYFSFLYKFLYKVAFI